MISDPIQPLTLEASEFCRVMAHHCKIPKSLEDCATSIIDKPCTTEQLQKNEYFSWLVKKKADKNSNADTVGKPNFDSLYKWRVKERLMLAVRMLKNDLEFDLKSKWICKLPTECCKRWWETYNLGNCFVAWISSGKSLIFFVQLPWYH